MIGLVVHSTTSNIIHILRMPWIPKRLHHWMKEQYVPIPVLAVQMIFRTAMSGQLLPRFSVLLLFQLIHQFFLLSCNFTLSDSCMQFSEVLLILCFAINCIGYSLLVALYRYSVQTIFNRQIPPSMRDCLPSFSVHLSMLRPLEIIFRYCTSRWRVLPDIIVIGEVRCGTTSLCQHLSDLDSVDCHTPFCLWSHPELDNKETFYFVGHYLGKCI